MTVPAIIESANTKVVITLTHGEPVTLWGPGMFDGFQRAIDARASWATFHVRNGKIAIRLDQVVSVLLIP